MSSIIIAYADGACRGNPGAGGWGVTIYSSASQRIWEVGGYDKHTTNNRMELKAVIGALQSIGEEPGAITFYVDSSYVVQGITQWVSGWRKRNWQTSTGGTVANRDLWEQLSSLVEKREKLSTINWQQVLGHAGIPGNERADVIAQAFADGKDIQLYDGKPQDYEIDFLQAPKPGIRKKDSKSRSSKKAYLYLSLTNGVLERHTNWDACQARVKGVPNAKFKKVFSPEEEKQLIHEWGLD